MKNVTYLNLRDTVKLALREKFGVLSVNTKKKKKSERTQQLPHVPKSLEKIIYEHGVLVCVFLHSLEIYNFHYRDILPLG